MEIKAFDRTDEEFVTVNPDSKNVEILSPLVKHETNVDGEEFELIYKISDVPPWYICIFLGFQHYLTAFGGNLVFPIVVANSIFCMNGDDVGISNLICTTFFISGLSSLLQTIFGCRLPIMQGANFGFLVPFLTLFSLPKWQCPYKKGVSVNITLPDVGSDGHREIWQLRLREFQGCLMVGSLIQIFIGFSGLMEVILSFVGPLTIMPTITLIGLALFEVATDYSAGQWYIALLTTVLICIFSQYMKNIDVPCFIYKKGSGCSKIYLSLFQIFPVLFAILISWLLCYILTVTDVFPKEKGKWGHAARTDIYSDVLYKSAWFRFPYPGQWGMPTVSTVGVLSTFTALFSSIIESIGDYYACARIAGVPPPPVHAINRGIGIEGITCFLAGAWGAASGNTSYSPNIGAILITKIASRRVIQVGALVMMLLGCFGKFSSLFVTIPQPVIGGIFFIMFGMITAIGISSLRNVSLDSSRNLFIIGTSLFIGLALPMWIQRNPGIINVGSPIIDQSLTVLLGTNMFVGGFLGLFFDNTLPGEFMVCGYAIGLYVLNVVASRFPSTDEERGMLYWKRRSEQDSSERNQDLNVYNLPAFCQRPIDKVHCFSFLPFCPSYNSYFSRLLKRICKCRNRKKEEKYTVNDNNGNEDLQNNSW